MKCAFHFDYEKLGEGNYIINAETALFRGFLKDKRASMHATVFSGDLLFSTIASERTETKTGWTQRVTKERLELAIEKWLHPENAVLLRFDDWKRLIGALQHLCVVCIEGISRRHVATLHDGLSPLPAYLGYMEVDDESGVHWALYTNALPPRFRVTGRRLGILGEKEEDDPSKEVAMQKLPFESVEWESLNLRYSFFDKNENYDSAKRSAAWRRIGGDFLSTIADSVLVRLSDPCPGIQNRLFAIIDAYVRAETDEAYSQVALSCRRLIEYTADNLFPAKEKDGKLGEGKFHNRLLAFADQERKSDTNIDLICISTKALAEQIEKLAKLVNKGIHQAAFQDEARRCIIRTILVLDDIVALKPSAFPIQADLDLSIFEDMAKKHLRAKNKL
jgi:hypothetical protein